MFAPFVEGMLKEEMAKCRFVALLTDASNHGCVKIFPVMVRYCFTNYCCQSSSFDITSENGETAELIFNLLRTNWESHSIADKVVGFCADKAPTNFGNSERGGQTNQFARLVQVMPHLIGIGCAAHIVHNALQAACDQMSIDIEVIVVKTYSHFY